jgi:hypothetical protein
MRVFKDRVLRGMFGPKRDEVIGGWKILFNQNFMIFTRLQI